MSHDHIKHFRRISETAGSSNLGPRAGLLNIKAGMQHENKTSEDKMEKHLEHFNAQMMSRVNSFRHHMKYKQCFSSTNEGCWLGTAWNESLLVFNANCMKVNRKAERSASPRLPLFIRFGAVFPSSSLLLLQPLLLFAGEVY